MARQLQAEIVEMLPRLWRFGLTLTRSAAEADDLVQSACERALSREAQLRGDTKIGAWMYTIMRNLWIDQIRARRTHLHDGIEAADNVVGDDGVALAERNDAWAAVRRGLASLPVQQRVALTLVCVDGMSYKEAAAILEVPIGTLTSRIARGREALHAQLTGLRSAPDAEAGRGTEH
jgi:RNA polymerase sigma-70 factor (ECF subfamily)